MFIILFSHSAKEEEEKKSISTTIETRYKFFKLRFTLSMCCKKTKFRKLSREKNIHNYQFFTQRVTHDNEKLPAENF
jgi:hypothetical protein